MIQLKILSGKMAGTSFVARHFPVRIGRAASADLQLEEPGVWDEHFQITLAGKEGFLVETHLNALATVNGQPAQQSPLRNGDVIEIGSLKIQFWLGEATQKGLKIREAFVWFMIAAVTLVELALIYWLIR
jgi:pSer/pThr/pTyr-binding forkhead associated (FHA) protein